MLLSVTSFKVESSAKPSMTQNAYSTQCRHVLLSIDQRSSKQAIAMHVTLASHYRRPSLLIVVRRRLSVEDEGKRYVSIFY